MRILMIYPQFLLLPFYVSYCQQQSTELEVRSVFLNCDLEEVISSPDNEHIRFQREEILKHNTLRNCKKKLAVTVKLCYIPSKTTGDEFIPIEHVLDAHDKRIRLLNPYILRLRRENPSQLYKLRKLEIVTGVFGSNVQKESRSHLLHNKYFEDKTSTKYDSLDKSDIYHMDTSAFSDDSAQMSYFENTVHQSLIPDKNKRLFQDAAESNQNGKNKRNNLTHDNQYVLYEIGNAELWYKSQIEVYEKMTLEGKIMWIDLTKREIASVSTLDPLWKNQDMSVRYLNKDVVKREDFDLPSGGLCLVLPLNYARENILPKDININNNGEFIIVPISDVIVVKSKQEGLRDLNLTDIKRKQRHVVIETARTLMIGNMADLNIMQHGDEGFLKLPLKTGHCTQMDLEVKADENKLIIPGSSARLTSVVSDTRDVRSVINLQVTNTGLAPAFFSVVPRECTPRIAEGFEESSNTNNTLIPPMHTNIFIMELPLKISHDDYRCSIALLNGDGVAVATRDVAIKKNDRCFCVWHCDCVCLGDDPKLICRDMSQVDVLAAGFSPHEGKRRVRSACYPDDVTINMFIIVIGVLLLLFMFGLLKACIGIILPCVGLMGMECILKIPRKLDQYYESSLRGRPVVYDKEGWPVHPDTKKRTVRLVSKPMEFILNVIMFIILPCILLRDAAMQMINKCKTEEKFRGKFQNTKKCFSSRDSQNVEPRWRRRKGDMRKWMTPQAEALSADIWDYGLSPTGDKKCDCRQPLLNDVTRNKEKQQVLHDSEQDDTAYVLTQIQKSKESLKN